MDDGDDALVLPRPSSFADAASADDGTGLRAGTGGRGMRTGTKVEDDVDAVEGIGGREGDEYTALSESAGMETEERPERGLRPRREKKPALPRAAEADDDDPADPTSPFAVDPSSTSKVRRGEGERDSSADVNFLSAAGSLNVP